MRVLLLLCLSLAACGGGGGAATTDTSVIPPPPVCCADNGAIAAELQAAEDQRLSGYDAARQSGNNYRAGRGTLYSNDHLTDIRDLAIGAVSAWCNDARSILQSYASQGLDHQAVADMIEDHRLSLMDYILADYDAFTSDPHWSGQESFVAQVRQEIVAGIDAAIDDLQVDAAGY